VGVPDFAGIRRTRKQLVAELYDLASSGFQAFDVEFTLRLEFFYLNRQGINNPLQTLYPRFSYFFDFHDLLLVLHAQPPQSSYSNALKDIVDLDTVLLPWGSSQ
jgi:hypothetical protein